MKKGIYFALMVLTLCYFSPKLYPVNIELSIGYFNVNLDMEINKHTLNGIEASEDNMFNINTYHTYKNTIHILPLVARFEILNNFYIGAGIGIQSTHFVSTRISPYETMLWPAGEQTTFKFSSYKPGLFIDLIMIYDYELMNNLNISLTGNFIYGFDNAMSIQSYDKYQLPTINETVDQKLFVGDAVLTLNYSISDFIISAGATYKYFSQQIAHKGENVDLKKETKPFIEEYTMQAKNPFLGVLGVSYQIVKHLNISCGIQLGKSYIANLQFRVKI